MKKLSKILEAIVDIGFQILVIVLIIVALATGLATLCFIFTTIKMMIGG